jgi:hypothetical protein
MRYFVANEGFSGMGRKLSPKMSEFTDRDLFSTGYTRQA